MWKLIEIRWLSFSANKRTPVLTFSSATPRSEAKTNDQMQNGLHSNHQSIQAQNFKQVYICAAYILDCARYHTMWSIRKYGNQ